MDLRETPPHWSSVQLPPDTRSPARARRFVESVLVDACSPEVIEVASILATELVANAVQHAGTPTRVAVVQLEDRLRVEVSDSSPAPPVLRRFGRGATCGRGVVIVDRLADAWGVDTAPGGKTVWAEVDCSAA